MSENKALPPGVSEESMERQAREFGPEDCQDHECRCVVNPPCNHCTEDCPVVHF